MAERGGYKNMKEELDEVRNFVSELKGSMYTIKWLLGAANGLILGAIVWGFTANSQIIHNAELSKHIESRLGVVEGGQKEYTEKVNGIQNQVIALSQQTVNVLSAIQDVKNMVWSMKRTQDDIVQTERNKQ